ncbi:serine-rich adhesin for platelets [Anopheles nili]|uniref:serine-rich adhesin for platelets n=1 Tax=Anopheles nili TaxID=185578 RepID=UPI00237BB6E3|nr:serine-rich adhesin for platelets [Anopheles nili]
MPRIDPMKLLVCLSVLLAPNGGIRNAGEVRRLANLMAKFSKKLVSKCIYIQILKCTETELLGQFMQTGGWSLVHMWLVDGIASKNWPLIQELLELLLCCPVDVERLKINSTPRLVKSLSTDSAQERVRVLASKLVEQWLSIVKAPKQLSPLMPSNQSEMQATSNIAGLTNSADGKLLSSGDHNVSALGSLGEQEGFSNGMEDNHNQQNGYIAQNGSKTMDGMQQTEVADIVDGSKKSFHSIGDEQHQLSPVTHKKTSLVLKITTKNGKQVVAKVVKSPSKRKSKRDPLDLNEPDDAEEYEDDYDDDDDDEDQEEVLVNIESDKPSSESASIETSEDKNYDGKDMKKLDVQNGAESSKERNSTSTKDKDRHHHSHREREKDRKGSISSSSRSSTSKSSSSSSSSSKHKSSSSNNSSNSKSSSSSSSRSKDRHGSSSSSSKHKSSSSSSSSSKSSSSKSTSSSSDKHRDHKSSHSSSGSKDSKNLSLSSSSNGSDKNSKLSRKSSKEDGGASNDSGSETGSISSNRSGKSTSATTIPSKKASISIEVRNPENRPKTVKTYNSQFRSHGLIEEAPPPPSRKGLKKPSSSSSTSPGAPTSNGPAIGSTATGTVKRSSPMSTGRDTTAGSPIDKKPKEDFPERPGSIKLIPPKRQHALVESDMFMDALSATLRKDVKKRKRRTSGSENTSTVVAKPGEVGSSSKPDGNPTKATDTESSTATTTAPSTKAASEEPVTDVTPAATTPTSPKVPTIAPMSFYRDTLAEDDDKGGESATTDVDDDKKVQTEEEKGVTEEKKAISDDKEGDDEDDDEGPVLKKSKRIKRKLNDDDEEENAEDGVGVGDKKVKKDPTEGAADSEDDKTELMDAVMNDVEKKIAAEAEESEDNSAKGDDEVPTGKKPPGPGCGPDGPPGVLVIHRRKGPKKQLRWRAAEDLEEVRYFELDVTERCNVTKSFTDMKQMERVDERQKFMLSRKVASEDIMVERTIWRPLVVVDNVPLSPDGNQSLERNVQRQRERGCLQALYFNKHMIPDSPVEPEPADIYQTADPVHIPLEDVTGNPDSVNDFTSVPWPDPKSTPPHESAAFNSPFFPTDLPAGAGFGPGGFPPPFAPGAAATIGPGPWNLGPPTAGGPGPRPGVLAPGMFPLNQPPPGMGGPPLGAPGGGGGSPNILNLPLNIPPNMPPPGMFPGATNFNAPPPEIGLLAGGPDAGGRRGPGDFRNGPPPNQQWVSNNRPFGGGGNNTSRGGFGNRGSGSGGGGNWNNRNNAGGNRNGGGVDRGRIGEEGRGNYRGHWVQNNNRGHNNNRGGGGRKW